MIGLKPSSVVPDKGVVVRPTQSVPCSLVTQMSVSVTQTAAAQTTAHPILLT